MGIYLFLCFLSPIRLEHHRFAATHTAREGIDRAREDDSDEE
jgi:hypothetical protein